MAEHTDELKRAIVAIRDLRRKVQQLESDSREPIAIIGSACRLPGGANTPEAFWELLRGGVDATREVPADRWNLDELYDPDPDAPGKMYTRRGGFLSEGVDRFDAAFFGISPREAATMDPIQRLLLELSWESLERAGIAPMSLYGSSTGVFVGVTGSDYNEIQNHGETLEDIDSYRGTGWAPCVTGGRISYVLGLQGPNVALDTACSSSLTAVTLAVESLRSGACEMAIAGGAHLVLAAESTIYLCRMRALSASGRCHTFDAAADGYARGEGAVVLLLKRLSHAQRDGDPVLAVIRGAAVNHDGRSSGLTVPNPAAQRAVIEAALRNAGLSSEAIDYVEAHGTGTPLGDPIELRALAEALGRGRSTETPLLVGSVKTNFGHLEAAAGAAGLLKLVLSLQHGELPPHLNCDNPTPHVDWDRIPIRVNRELRSWPSTDRTPVAGVSAFGFSGTNAHVIVERAPEQEAVERVEHPAELIVVSGQSPSAARESAHRYAQILASADAPSLADVALTSLLGRTHFASRSYAVAATREEMRERLAAIARGEALPEIGAAEPAGPGRVAFLFTGQGSQSPGMGKELFDASPTARAVLERCDEIVRPHLDRSLIDLLVREEDPEILKRTEYAQPALFALEYAVASLWRHWGIEPAYLVGHSLGEYVAATVAGVMTLEEVLPLVVLRGRLMGRLPGGGAMAAVLAPEAVAVEALRAEPSISVAAVNGPENVVVSGDADALDRLAVRLADEGVQCKRLHVSHAFHSARMEPILDEFEAAVSAVRLSPPSIPLVSNLTGRLMTDEEATDPARWRRHLREPVRFSASIVELDRLGVETYVEVGPHPSLIAMATASATRPGTSWLPSMRRGRGAWGQFLESLGELWRLGAEIDLQAFGAEHGGRRVIAPTYPFQRERHWFTDNRKDRPALPSSRRRDQGWVHPLIGRQLRSPAIEGWVFESLLSPEEVPYLDDHRVGGEVYLPAAAFVEMFTQAAKHGPGWSGVELRDLAFERPLVLADGADTACQVVLGAAEGDAAAARIVAEDADGEWRTVARARVVRHTGAAAEAAYSSAPVSRDVESLAVDELYETLAARGIDYGPAFRTLVQAERRGEEAWGRVELQHGDIAGGYGAHPTLLDGALHLLAAIAERGDDPDATYLPTGVDCAMLLEPLGSDARVHVRITAPAGADSRFSADVRLLSAEGRVLAQLEGFHAERARLPATTARRSDRRYEVVWEEVPATPAAGSIGGQWVLVGGSGELRTLVRGALERAGAEATMAVGSVAELERLADAADGLVLLVDSSKAEHPAEVLAEASAHFEELRALLTSSAGRAGARLLVITTGAEGSGDSAIAPGSSALRGAFAAIRAEHPELAPRLIELGETSPSARMLADAVVAVLGDEDRLAVTDRGLMAPRLERTVGDPEAADGPPIDPDGCYVVTGGGGGVGRVVASWLVEEGAGAVVLNGRSGPDAVLDQWLEELRSSGVDVRWAAADISTAGGARDLIEAALATGRPVRGLFHTAGVVDDGLMSGYDARRFDRVAAPKIAGALHLHEAAKHLELDHFVLFSSTAAVLAGPGQAAYGAANAVLGAIARLRRGRGLPALCIDWGGWAGQGMLARMSDRERTLLEERGLLLLDPQEAIGEMRDLMASGAPHGIVMQIDWPRLAQATRLAPIPLLANLTGGRRSAASAETTEGAGVVPHPEELVSLAPEARTARLSRYLLPTLASVLRMKEDRIHPGTSIAQLGFDSLMAVELRNRIEQDLGVALPVVRILSSGSPAELVEHLSHEFGGSSAETGSLEQPTDAEPIETFEF